MHSLHGLSGVVTVHSAATPTKNEQARGRSSSRGELAGKSLSDLRFARRASHSYRTQWRSPRKLKKKKILYRLRLETLRSDRTVLGAETRLDGAIR